MTRYLLILLVAWSAFAGDPPTPVFILSTNSFIVTNVPPNVTNEWIIKAKSGRLPLVTQKVHNHSNKHKLKKHIDRIGSDFLETVGPYNDLFAQITNDCEYIQPQRVLTPNVTPNDTLWTSQWDMTDISMPLAWGTTNGSSNVIVAIFDSGIDYTHPDLKANLYFDVGTGTNGWECFGGVVIPGGSDALGHGTHVAGTIGAVGNNSLGIAGVNWNVRLLSMKFIDGSGSGYNSDCILLIDKLIDLKTNGLNVRVSNNSWGGANRDLALQDAFQALENAGVLSICASGNNGLNIDNVPESPGGMPNRGVITVNAHDSSDLLTSFSNYGFVVTDISAPGLSTLSTMSTNVSLLYHNSTGYGNLSGTSMATPHVAGVAALLFALKPSLTVYQAKDIILNQRSYDVMSDAGGYMSTTGGRLDANKVLTNSLVANPATNSPPSMTYLSYSNSVGGVAASVDIVGVDPNNDTLRFSILDISNALTFHPSFNLTPLAHYGFSPPVYKLDVAKQFFAGVGDGNGGAVGSNFMTTIFTNAAKTLHTYEVEPTVVSNAGSITISLNIVSNSDTNVPIYFDVYVMGSDGFPDILWTEEQLPQTQPPVTFSIHNTTNAIYNCYITAVDAELVPKVSTNIVVKYGAGVTNTNAFPLLQVTLDRLEGVAPYTVNFALTNLHNLTSTNQYFLIQASTGSVALAGGACLNCVLQKFTNGNYFTGSLVMPYPETSTIMAFCGDKPGTTTNVSYFDPNVMWDIKPTIVSGISTAPPIVAPTCACGIQWLQTNQPNYVAQANGVATDKSGNVIVVGAFKNTVDFGQGPTTGAGFWDGFVAKYTQQGSLVWYKTFGNAGFDSANAVAIDSQTNIIVVGTFQTSMDLGVGTMTVNGGTGQDAFAAKFSPAGTCLWSTNWGSSSTDTATGVAIDSSDNVIATSSSGGVVNFNNGTLSGHGGTDVAIIKLASASGTTLWGQLYGSTFNDTPNALAVDNNNNVYVTGMFNSTGAGSGDLGGAALSGSTNTGIFLAKYSGSTGAFVWSRIFGGNGGYGVATDPVNTNVFLTGGFTGYVDFGGGLISGAFGHSGAFFLASFDTAGTYRFANAWGGNGDIGYALTVKSNSMVALTGNSTGTIDWYGAGNTVTGSGYLLANFTTAGDFQWAIRGNNSQSFGYAVAYDLFGHVMTAGTFFFTTDFGGRTATAGLGDNNLFVAQYSQSHDYFVDGTNGNDSNSGTSWAHAFATEQKAANTVTNCDVVTVTNTHWFTERTTLKSSCVTWQGLGTTNWGFQGNQGVNGQFISGFYVHNTNAYGGGNDIVHFSGIYCAGSSWVISNNFCWENGQYGINLDGRTNSGWPSVTNNLVVNNLSQTNGFASINEAGVGNWVLSNDFARNVQFTAFCTNTWVGPDADGAYIFGSFNRFTSNYVHDINYADPKNVNVHADLLQLYGVEAGSLMGQTHDILVDANILDGTHNGVMVANGNGVFVEGTSNIWVINNAIRAHRGGAFGSSSSPSYNCYLINNTLIGQTNDALANLSTAWAWSLGRCTNAVLENNVLFNWTNIQFALNNQFSGLTSWKNMKWRDDGVPVIEDSAYTPWLANDFENVNPKLSNAYANPPLPLLLSNSPAIDAGFVQTVVTNDIFGVRRPVNLKYDIGASEYPGTNATPSSTIAKVTNLKVTNATIGP